MAAQPADQEPFFRAALWEGGMPNWGTSGETERSRADGAAIRAIGREVLITGAKDEGIAGSLDHRRRPVPNINEKFDERRFGNDPFESPRPAPYGVMRRPGDALDCRTFYPRAGRPSGLVGGDEARQPPDHRLPRQRFPEQVKIIFAERRSKLRPEVGNRLETLTPQPGLDHVTEIDYVAALRSYPTRSVEEVRHALEERASQ